MAVAHRTRVTCPRCASPVTGDFKFCPACAYRLRAGAPSPDEQVPPAPRRAGLLLLALGAAGFVAAMGALGVRLFRDGSGGSQAAPPRAQPVISADELRIASLRKYLVRLDDGTAELVEDEQDGQPVLRRVWVPKLEVMLFETTRALYAEFLAEMLERVRAGASPGAVFTAIWDARTTSAQDYARSYLEAWVDAFVRHAEARGERPETALDPLLRHLPEGLRREAVDAGDLARLIPFPWPAALGLLLAVPPSWAYVDSFGQAVWALPEGTGLLPVTEVAWTDANAFAEWASARLGLDLRLPVEGEWVRIAHGNHPAEEGGPVYDWPWGATPLFHACNNFNAWPVGMAPGLQPVDTRYLEQGPEGLVDGRTAEGIFGMAGNAREWVLAQAPQFGRAGQWFQVSYDAQGDSARPTAPAYGGSYRMGLYDCTVSSHEFELKQARKEDLGFRLVAQVPL
jgi:formylglycine-generating enzyme required for sulfatase activity